MAMARRVQMQSEEQSGFTKKHVVALLLCLGILPGLWLQSSYLAEWLGEGRTHFLAVVVGLVAAPLVGFFWLVRHHPKALKVTGLLWGITAWVSSLFFFFVIPETTSQVITSHGAWMFSFAGAKTRARGDRVMDSVARSLPGASQSVPFSFEQGSIVVQATIEGNGRSLPVRMVLDTGASFTTISPQTAAALGVAPGPRSPLLHVQTAGGEATYPLVVLPGLTLGTSRVGPLAAAVCEPCAVGDKVGLLGLNFTSHFQMVIDNKTGRVRMRPVEDWVDRRAEVEPFLEVHGLAGSEEGDLMRITAQVTNLSPEGVSNLAFEVTLTDDADRALNVQRVTVDRIEAGATHTLNVGIAAQPGCASFRLELRQASWLENKI